MVDISALEVIAVVVLGEEAAAVTVASVEEASSVVPREEVVTVAPRAEMVRAGGSQNLRLRTHEFRNDGGLSTTKLIPTATSKGKGGGNVGIVVLIVMFSLLGIWMRYTIDVHIESNDVLEMSGKCTEL